MGTKPYGNPRGPPKILRPTEAVSTLLPLACQGAKAPSLGKVILNNAFVEILSGTTKTGNSLKAPLDTIRLYGVIPTHFLRSKRT